MNNTKETSRGITLIALVITIIILLILAAISIISLRENGLFQKAKIAKEKSDYSSAYEILILKINEANIEKGDICTLEELEKFLSDEKELEILVTKYNETAKKKDGIGDYQIGELKNIVVNVLKYKKYYFLIGEECKVIKVSNDYGNTFIDIEKFNITQASEDLNYDWKEILKLAKVDESKYNSLEEALEDVDVIEAIISNKEAINCLINSSNDIIDITVKNGDVLEKLASNESVGKDIINNEKWYSKIQESENSERFFYNINITETETLNLVNDENPYYTFEAKANKSYFIQCYGAQGGSYSEYNHGGYGGYSYGIFTPSEDTILYIYKGGRGIGPVACATIEGGYNGGGSVPRLVGW